MIYDCIIIGAGAAGLSTALGLGRVGRSCVVIAHAKHRNKGARHIHTVLTRDHIEPQEFYAIARQQIEGYGNTTFVEGEVIDVGRNETETTIFTAKDAGGRSWQGRGLVLATGVRDVMPGIEGYAENWPHNM
jgi:gliotoxin/aspirochlorine biosynthesis thioredoxin reductase